jgi:hypothetical protein
MLNSGLDMHLREWAARPFAWGSTDCVLFADAWVRRVTGRSAIPQDAQWHDEVTGRSLIASLGNWAGIARTVSLPRTSAPMAGDVVLARIGDGAALGIQATRGPVFMTEDGIVRTTRVKIIRAWRVDAP